LDTFTVVHISQAAAYYELNNTVISQRTKATGRFSIFQYT